MNVITLNTEENELIDPTNVQGDDLITKHTERAKLTESKDDSDPVDFESVDNNEGPVDIALPVFSAKKMVHQRNKSLIEKVKGSILGIMDVKASFTRERTKPETPLETEQISIRKGQDNHKLSDIPSARIFPASATPLRQKLGISSARRLLNNAIADEIGQADSSADGSKINLASARSSSNRLRTASLSKTVNSSDDRANVLVDARVGKIMKGVAPSPTLKPNQTCKINPRSKFKFTWDFIISVSLFYYVFIIPYRVAFLVYTLEWRFFDLFMDLLFTADIVLKFLTGITVKGEIVYDKKRIAMSYLKSRFVVDLTCILPLYFIQDYLIKIKIVRFTQINRFIRVTNIIFARFLSTLLNGRINIKIYDIFTAIYKILFFFVAFSHIMNCIWIAIGFYSKSKNQDSFLDMYGTQTPTNYQIYLDGLYFTFNTITKVGYGDIVPLSDYEMLYVMLMVSIGMGTVAFLEGHILYIIKKFDSRRKKLYRNNEALEVWLCRNEIAKGTKSLDHKYCEQVKSFFYYVWTKDIKSVLWDQQYFVEIPPHIQRAVGNLVFKGTMNGFKYFFNLFSDEDFKLNVFEQLRPVAFIREQAILSRGQRIHGLYFILSGKVGVHADDENGALTFLPAYSFFGEQLVLQKTSNFTFIGTSGLVQCLHIKTKAILSILESFPDEREVLERLAMMRNRNLSRVRRETVKLSKKGRRTLLLQHRGNNYNFQEAAEAVTNNQEKVDPIKESLSKLEATIESCEVNLPEGELLERNMPFRHASTTGNILANSCVTNNTPIPNLSDNEKEKNNIAKSDDEQPPKNDLSPHADHESCVVAKSLSDLVAGNVPKFLRDSTMNKKSLNKELHILLKEEKKEPFEVQMSSPRYSGNTFGKNLGENYEKLSKEFRLNVFSHSSVVSHEIDFASQWVIDNALNPLYPLSMPPVKALNTGTKDFHNQSFDDIPIAKDSMGSPVWSDRSFDGFEDEIADAKDDDQLNRSMEEPIDDIQPVFAEGESMERIVIYLKDRLKMLSHKMQRIEKEIRLDVTELKRKLTRRQRVHRELFQSKTRDIAESEFFSQGFS